MKTTKKIIISILTAFLICFSFEQVQTQAKAKPLAGYIKGSKKKTAGYKAALKALTRLHCPYVYGAAHSKKAMKNKHQRKFDCSGLVSWAYAQSGHSIGIRTSKSCATAGKKIKSLKKAKPGDILTFSRNHRKSGVCHAAIYLGGGLMVHAPHRHSTVRVARVQRGLFAIRRIC